MEFKNIIRFIIIIVVLYIIYTAIKLFKSIPEGAKSAADAVENSAIVDQVSSSTKVSKEKVNQLFEAARRMAYELNTFKGVSVWDKISNMIEIDKLLKLWNNAVTSKQEAEILKAFYNNQHTEGNNLKDDILNATGWIIKSPGKISEFKFL